MRLFPIEAQVCDISLRIVAGLSPYKSYFTGAMVREPTPSADGNVMASDGAGFSFLSFSTITSSSVVIAVIE